MSNFLNSVLSSIGGEESSPAQSSKPGSAAPPRKLSSLGTSASERPSVAQAPVKRKAEGDTGDERGKAAKRDGQPPTNGLQGKSSASTLVTGAKPPQVQSSNQSAYRGTARPSSTIVMPRIVKKPATSVSAHGPPAAKPSPGLPSPAGSVPKKGSFKEVMERAKAAKAVTPVGTIKHKPVEKMTKKERLAQAEAEKSKQAQGKDKKIPTNGQKKAAGLASKKDPQPEKEKRKPADLGYKGTMRPSSSDNSYKGTLNRGKAAAPAKVSTGGYYNQGRSGGEAGKSKEKVRYAGYASYSEDDDEDEEALDSEGSSDMEAGAFDLDTEEMMSLRQAKREDEEALRQEEELKDKKAQRKKLLENMAAAAAKRRQP